MSSPGRASVACGTDGASGAYGIRSRAVWGDVRPYGADGSNVEVREAFLVGGGLLVQVAVDGVADHLAHGAGLAALPLLLGHFPQPIELIHVELEGVPNHLAPEGASGAYGCRYVLGWRWWCWGCHRSDFGRWRGFLWCRRIRALEEAGGAAEFVGDLVGVGTLLAHPGKSSLMSAW